MELAAATIHLLDWQELWILANVPRHSYVLEMYRLRDDINMEFGLEIKYLFDGKESTKYGYLN